MLRPDVAPSPYRVRTYVEPPIPDLPGYDLKPDPLAASTVAEFVEALGWLRVWAGAPSLRELSRRCGRLPAHTMFSTMLRSETLPPRDLVLAFVNALGLSEDRDRWAEAWRLLAMRPGKGLVEHVVTLAGDGDD